MRDRIWAILLIIAAGLGGYFGVRLLRHTRSTVSVPITYPIVSRLIARLDKPGMDDTCMDDLMGPMTDSDMAAGELLKLGEAPVQGLIDALRDKLPIRRRWAARLLGEIGDPRAVAPLSQMLDRREGNEATVEEALGRLKDPGAVEALDRALELPSDCRRTGINWACGSGWCAARVLATLGGPVARPVFYRNLKSPNNNRRLNAKAGLEMLAGRTGLPDRF